MFLFLFVFGVLKSLIRERERERERERDRLEIRFLRHSSAAGLVFSSVLLTKVSKLRKKEE